MESRIKSVSSVRKPKLPPGRDHRLAGDEEKRLLEHTEYPMHGLVVLARDRHAPGRSDGADEARVRKEAASGRG